YLLLFDLCLAQGVFLTRYCGRRCIYLIDDFASELDDSRRGLLASRLKSTQSHVFVSAISAEHVIDMSDENSKMFTV
ncbi:DNA replication/repair protein RecF, partial [Salmonella enterica subsp. enterica serovar Infantis]